jgi:hypothetical protein
MDMKRLGKARDWGNEENRERNGIGKWKEHGRKENMKNNENRDINKLRK